MKKIIIGLLSIIMILCTSACSSDSKDNETNNKELVLATAQMSLKEYNINSKTSSSLEDWTINKMEYEETYRWTATTYDENNKRVKCIFEWSGKDEDDLVLKYLFYAGNEYYNKLK